MLPKSRVFCVMLLGLSAALLVVGVLLPRYVHADSRLPLSLGQTTMVLRDNNGTVGSGESEYKGALLKQVNTELMDPVDATEVTLRIGMTLSKDIKESDLNRLVNAKIWSYRMDRITGEAVGDATLTDQIVGPTQTVAVDGVWTKFPMDAGQGPYQVFDDTLRQSRPAHFVGEERREGRTILHFRQDIQPVNVATLFADAANTTNFAEPDGAMTSGYLFHSAVRDWYVDRASGLIIDAEEHIDDFYGTREGEKREQVILFHGKVTPDSASTLMSQASSVSNGNWVHTTSTVLLGAGGALAFVGLIGVFGAFSLGRGRSERESRRERGNQRGRGSRRGARS